MYSRVFRANYSARNFPYRLDFFFPHAVRLGFVLHIPSFISGLAQQSGSPARPHQALLDVVGLWGIRLAQSQRPEFAAHEPSAIARALASIPAALGSPDPRHRVQVVQAEVLLALFFFCEGRLLEGRYHATAAMSAALSGRLHQIGYPESADPRGATSRGGSRMVVPGSNIDMPPPRDTIELGERINVFWTAFALDRCWSVALGCPPSLLDERTPSLHISSPLPRRMEDYAQVYRSFYLGSNG